MKTIFFLLLSLSLYGQPDKNKHWLAGAGISYLVGATVYQVTDRVTLSCFSGFIVSSTVGILKENLWDRILERGTYDKEDAFVTSWGALHGMVILRVSIDIHQRRLNKKYN